MTTTAEGPRCECPKKPLNNCPQWKELGWKWQAHLTSCLDELLCFVLLLKLDKLPLHNVQVYKVPKQLIWLVVLMLLLVFQTKGLLSRWYAKKAGLACDLLLSALGGALLLWCLLLLLVVVGHNVSVCAFWNARTENWSKNKQGEYPTGEHYF